MVKDSLKNKIAGTVKKTNPSRSAQNGTQKWGQLGIPTDPRGPTCLAMAMAAIVAMAAAIVTIANVVMAAVVEPQQSWS